MEAAHRNTVTGGSSMSGVALDRCLFLKACNCRERNWSESTWSPSFHPFRLNHCRCLLMPYLNLCCSTSGPSGLILPATETRSFPSSTTASWRFKDMPQQRNTVFWANHHQLTPSCHRLCFPDVSAFLGALHWALRRRSRLSCSTLCRTAHGTPAAPGQSNTEQTYCFTCLMDCNPFYYTL